MDNMEISSAKNQKKVREPRKPIRVSLGVVFLCILLTGVIVFMATFVPYSLYCERQVNEAYARFSKFDKLIQVAELYDESYLYDVDQDLLNEALASAYVYGCGDRFASYYTAEEWAAYVAEASGSSVGIGVYVVYSETGGIEVVQVMSGSPAEAAGLAIGDIIVSVDGQAVTTLGYENAVNMVRGEVGTELTVEVLRESQTLHFTVTRGIFEPETVFAETVRVDDELIGYIYITEFTSVEVTANQFIDAVEGLKELGVDSLIFDVRNNPGGDLNAIVEILDYLLPEGPIVHLFDADGNSLGEHFSDASGINLPMVVLANENTASAAELFTSALNDYDKAEIVGTTTFGKGCGQQGSMLSDGSVVFITTFFYNPPYSENYDGIGIIPDYEVELPEEWKNKNLFLIPHDEDSQLAKAIALLVGES